MRNDILCTGPQKNAAPRQLRVRLMRPEDVKCVAEISAQSFRQPLDAVQLLEELKKINFSFSFVIEFHTLVVGYAIIWVAADEAQIIQIAVARDFRQQGVGRELLRRLLREAREGGVRYVYLEVRRSNVAAQNLYRKFGFRVEGVRRNYYVQENEDALVMSLCLQEGK